MSKLGSQIIIHCPTSVFIETDGDHAGSLHVIMYPTSPSQEEDAAMAIVKFAEAHDTPAKITGRNVFASTKDHSTTVSMYPRSTANTEEQNNGITHKEETNT